jgi:predicted acylesterase/phospholipase RssA
VCNRGKRRALRSRTTSREIILLAGIARVADTHLSHESRPPEVRKSSYRSGRRVAFGRPGAPSAGLPDAVVASCSIPGWYAPKEIDGRAYVDGGVR